MSHDTKQHIANHLEAGRQRSLGLVAPLTDEELWKAYSRLMSPLVWDLGHIANYEELWLLRQIAGHPATDESYDDLYNAFEHPRWERPSLPILGPPEARAYLSEVRGRALDVLESIEFDPQAPLLRDGYVYGMVVQHEHMHNETMLSTLQLRREAYPLVVEDTAPVDTGPEMVRIDAGPFQMGTSTHAWAFDNERPAHRVELPAFWIDTTPVTIGAYQQFIDDGGYSDPRGWSESGWKWRTEKNLTSPGFWNADGTVRRFGHDVPRDPRECVQHVCYYEAEAYASWAGKRLPTEAEWEKAASWRPDGSSHLHPWGAQAPEAVHANLSQRRFGPSPVGSYPKGATATGIHQMLGDVWEWTSTDFGPYPGYGAFPYREYSEVFFGSDYKVLRGGSWATHSSVARNTVRNWDYPIRRQIFSGFRCARDA